MDNATKCDNCGKFEKMRGVGVPEKMQNLWQVTAFVSFGQCYTFGYFDDEVQARVFALRLRNVDNMSDSFNGDLVGMDEDDRVWLRPEAILAIEIDHPYDYEVRNSWWKDQE